MISTASAELERRTISGPASPAPFIAAAILIFVASAAVTISLCGSMSAMPEMDMPGGWTMSMTWMRMPGQTWGGAAGSFIGMWAVMMTAMMLPALFPALWPYRRAATAAAFVGLGYFCVWTLVGLALFPAGAAIASLQMRFAVLARATPFAGSLAVVAAGAVQVTPWKRRRLACCRTVEPPVLPFSPASGFRHGIRLGLDCVRCCGNLMAVLIVVGVMDLRAMALVTAAITLERLGPGN